MPYVWLTYDLCVTQVIITFDLSVACEWKCHSYILYKCNLKRVYEITDDFISADLNGKITLSIKICKLIWQQNFGRKFYDLNPTCNILLMRFK